MGRSKQRRGQDDGSNRAKKGSDQPRYMKPRKTNSSMIGPARQPPTNRTNRPPGPPTTASEPAGAWLGVSTICATIQPAAATSANANSFGLGQFSARYSAKSRCAMRIATHSTARVGGYATINATPYQRRRYRQFLILRGTEFRAPSCNIRKITWGQSTGERKDGVGDQGDERRLAKSHIRNDRAVTPGRPLF